MNNLKNALLEYGNQALQIETLKGHQNYFRKIALGPKNALNKESKAADALIYVHDLEKYIQTCEDQLYEIDISCIPQPIPLERLDDFEQERTYPVASLPSVLRDAIEAISEHVQAPLGLAAHVVLSAATHIAQARVNAVSLYNEPMPCSLFILSLGDSGSRKSTCHRLAFKTINERERLARLKYQQNKINPADKAKAADTTKENISYFDLDPQETMSDVVFEGLVGHMIRGCSFLSVDSDDAAQWFGGHSLTSTTRLATCAGYTKAFDNGFFERNRSISNANGSGFAYNRRLSVSLMAQDVVIKKFLLDPDLQGQGLLPRFVFSTSTSLAGQRLISHEAPINQNVTDPRLLRYWERCDSRSLIPPKVDPSTREVKPPSYFLDDEANRLWIDCYNYLEKEQGPGGEYADIPAFASRGGELVRRLATVISFFDEKNHVDAISMQSAIEIILHSIYEWSKYMESSSQKNDDDLAMDMVKKLSEIKLRCFRKRTLQQRGPSYVRKSAATAASLLSTLETYKYVFSLDEIGRGYYLINPHFLRDQGLG